MCILSPPVLFQDGSAAPPLSEDDQLSLAIALSLEQAAMAKGKVGGGSEVGGRAALSGGGATLSGVGQPHASH